MNIQEDFIAIDLEVTSACNADCGFCPREALPDRNRYVSMDVIEHLADEMKITPMLRKTVVLCGIGESTLHPELNRIVQTLSSAGARVEMTTNGERTNGKRFEELIEQGLSSFNFSLNAATSETHRKVMRLKRFDRIMDNLQEILEVRQHSFQHIPLNVSFVVCNLNHHEVTDFVEFWRTKGISQIWLHPINNRAGLLTKGVGSVDLGKFERKYQDDDLVTVDIFRNAVEKENLCKIARSLIFISSDGMVRLCAMDYQRLTSYGIVGQKPVREMHIEKLLGYARGEMTEFCIGCDFCPSGIVKASDNPFVIDNGYRLPA